MLKKLFLVLFLLTVGSYASFEEGKKLFMQKCASCHKEYISFKKLKVNFYERNNELLKLTTPTENMLAWAIMDGSKKIGDPEDPEMRQIEIEEFLKEYLENPDITNSICDERAKMYYVRKEPMPISDEEAEILAQYFMGYKEDRLKSIGVETVVLTEKFDEKKILEEAANSGRQLIVYATSQSCYFCKKMDREVLELKHIQQTMNEDYIFIKVDVDRVKLPFGLKKYFKGMTPTFFVMTSSAQLLNTYPGAWVEEDFLQILKENL